MNNNLEDFFEVKNGYAFTSAQQLSEPTLDAVEILKQGHIEIGGGLRKSPKKSYVHLSDKLRKFMLEKDDIVMAMTDMKDNVVILGIPAIIDKSDCYVINQRVAWLKPRLNTNVRFFYYQMLTNEFLEELRSKANSGVQVNLSINNIKEMKFWAPPLPEQQAIAEVLSSIDDKIDLLNRNNKTLEEMAETLFRQWFVEGAKEEWEEKPLKYFGQIICGKTPSTSNKDFFDGSIPFVKIPDMHRHVFIFNTTTTLTESGVNSQPKKTLPVGAIMVSCIATVGLVAISTASCQTNQQINSIVPSESHFTYFLFLSLKNMKDELKTLAGGGSVTDNLNTTDFSNIGINMPNEDILKNFDQLVNPIFEKIKYNAKNIITLGYLRDTLLPKLMSGQVRVER
jgi:type I restriction enzyme S subunit